MASTMALIPCQFFYKLPKGRNEFLRGRFAHVRNIQSPSVNKTYPTLEFKKGNDYEICIDIEWV